MNENIDLTRILKNCPKGTKFYSSLHGDLLYSCMYISSSASKITFIKTDSVSMVDGTTPITVNYYRDGRYYPNQGECTIFPSKDQRDWSKFTAPWYKKEKFNPQTLHECDKVIVRCSNKDRWICDLFSHAYAGNYIFTCSGGYNYKQCVVPYNDETKHLIGTNKEAPEYYRYWED